MKRLLTKLSQDKVKVTMKFWHEIIAKDDPRQCPHRSRHGPVELEQVLRGKAECWLLGPPMALAWQSNEPGPGFIQGVPSGAASAGAEDTAAA